MGRTTTAESVTGCEGLSRFKGGLIFGGDLHQCRLGRSAFGPVCVGGVAAVVSGLGGDGVSGVVNFNSIKVRSSPQVSRPGLGMVTPVSQTVMGGGIVAVECFSVNDNSSKKMGAVTPRSVFSDNSGLCIEYCYFGCRGFLRLIMSEVVRIIRTVNSTGSDGLRYVSFY